LCENRKVKNILRVFVSFLLIISIGINIYFVYQTLHKSVFQVTAESLVGTYTTASDPRLSFPNSPYYIIIEHNLTYCIFTQEELLEMGTVEEIRTNQFRLLSQDQQARQLLVTDKNIYLFYMLHEPAAVFTKTADFPGYVGNWNFSEMQAFSAQYG
jgi:hypothetical protein